MIIKNFFIFLLSKKKAYGSLEKIATEI